MPEVDERNREEHVGAGEAGSRSGDDHGAGFRPHAGIPLEPLPPLPVLADAVRTVVKDYGVYVRANFEPINIARPANFVLDAAGTIRFIHIASVQFGFASFVDILAAFDAI